MIPMMKDMMIYTWMKIMTMTDIIETVNMQMV